MRSGSLGALKWTLGALATGFFASALVKFISICVPIFFFSIASIPGGMFSFPPPEPTMSLEKDELCDDRDVVLKGPRFGGAARDLRGAFLSLFNAGIRLFPSSSDNVTRSRPMSGEVSRTLRGACVGCPGWMVKTDVSSDGM